MSGFFWGGRGLVVWWQKRQAGSIYREYVHTPSYRGIAVTGPQRSTRKLYGSQTGRASGINAETRTTELEVVIDLPLFHRQRMDLVQRNVTYRPKRPDPTRYLFVF